MINIIKQGNGYKNTWYCNCHRCGCEFSYQDEDIQVPLFAPISYDGTTRQFYVECPCCGSRNYVWHWPDHTAYKTQIGEYHEWNE